MNNISFNEITFDSMLPNVQEDNEIIIFGFGEVGRFIYCLFEHSHLTQKIKLIVDKKARGSRLHVGGLTVESPEEIRVYKDAKIIVATLTHKAEILELLISDFHVKKERIVLVKMNELTHVPMSDSSSWLQGAQEEVFFWEKSLATRHRFHRLADERANPEKPFAKKILDEIMFGEVTSLNVLDVGSGPVTALGYANREYDIKLTLTDPLAEEYKILYEKYRFHPPVKPIACFGEELLGHFGKETFEVVYSCNALDHTENPLRILENMCHLLIPSGVLYVEVFENEGVKAQYCGLHKWNFSIENEQLILWNQNGDRFVLNEHLGSFGSLKFSLQKGKHRTITFVLMKKQ